MGINNQKVKIISVQEYTDGIILIRDDESIEYAILGFGFSIIIYPHANKKKYKIRGAVLELILEGNPSILYQNKLYYIGDEFNCNGVLSVKVFKKSITVYDTEGSLIIEFFHNIDLGPSAVIKLSNEMTFFRINHMGQVSQIDNKKIADRVQRNRPTWLGYLYALLRGS